MTPSEPDVRGPLTKRIFDLGLAALLLIVFAIPMALIALAIRLRMGRPVLYVQVRPGLDEQLFRLYKFRTMIDAEDPFHLKLDDGERITPLGRFLRATSLDELPQLWNVLRGDMSLVGPRPLLPAYLDRYTARQARRHEVRPGITGLAQVSGRNALSWPERLELDVRYVEERSLWLDLVIIGRTVGRVLRRHGISQPGQATYTEFPG
jgi:sugar transferase EpsL